MDVEIKSCSGVSCSCEKVSQDALLSYIYTKINKPPTGFAYVYAAFLDGIHLGKYADGTITLGNAQTCTTFALSDTPQKLGYLQEFRVFHQSAELRAIRMRDSSFACRFREEQVQSIEKNRWIDYGSLYALDELHKLWGESSSKTCGIQEWALLDSQRGNRLLVPMGGALKKGVQKVAVQVRRYLQFGKASENNAPLRFVDERMCGFVPFAEEEKKRNG